MEFGNETRSENEEENIRFYYSHEDRIKHAPKIVQDYYNGSFQLQKGFRVLFKNKSNRFLLITLCALTAFAMIMSRSIASANKGTLGENKIQLDSFSFEDSVYTTLKITSEKEIPASEKTPVTVTAVFSAFNADNQKVHEETRSLLIQKNEETISFRITDFEIIEMKAEVSDGTEAVNLTAQVKR